MRLEWFLDFGAVGLNIESVSIPGANENPVRGCTWIEGLEVTYYRLADARGDIKEIASIDRFILIGKSVQFFCFFSVAVHTAAKPCRIEGPFSKSNNQAI